LVEAPGVTAVIVKVPMLPWPELGTITLVEGEDPIDVTISEAVAVEVRLALCAVRVKEYVPAGVAEPVVTVRFVLPEVRKLGNVNTPPEEAGSPETLKLTGPSNPASEETDTAYTAFPPGNTVRAPGKMVMPIPTGCDSNCDALNPEIVIVGGSTPSIQSPRNHVIMNGPLSPLRAIFAPLKSNTKYPGERLGMVDFPSTKSIAAPELPRSVAL
jgi:hypothetical protein